MKVLVIEDDEILCDILKGILEESGYIVEVISDGAEGLFHAEAFPPDALVLDILLPTLDGLSILKRLRKNKIKTPVLLLTSRAQVHEKVEGLDLGADDYLAKPFEYGEFLARVRAILRRGKGEATPRVTIGDLEIDTLTRAVLRKGQPISLTAKEYNLFEYLALNAGRVVGRGELLEHLYGFGFESDSNLIDVNVARIRNKVEIGSTIKLIHTFRGAGYMVQGLNGS